ncbi:MAG: DUF4012 domain-containing protein [Microgenomates group bacterium]|nr:DUF4012 domain-containing protein [Microgenomates group bacterium]
MIKKILLIFGAILISLTVYFYFAFRNIKVKANSVFASANELKTAFKSNNIDLVDKKLTILAEKYKDFEQEAKTIYWLSFIPYIADFKNGVEAGTYLINAGQESVKAISPYADLIGFRKGETSFVEKSAEDRLQTAVLTLDKVLLKIEPISKDIQSAEELITKINPNRYPEKIGKVLIRSKIIQAQEQFMGLSSLFVDAKPFLKKLPEILGKGQEKTYLILFQNDKEKRATGGFITAYAIFKIKDGKMRIERSADIYSLDDSIANHPPAPREIQTYHLKVNKFYIRDSNLSPDFYQSIQLFDQLFQKSSLKIKYDGIIAIDTKILVDMLKIFGDTEVRGIRFSANIDKRCNCPQVIYRLLDEIDRPVAYIKEDRKGILGDLMYALFYKAIGFSPSKYWGTLVEMMFKNLDEKHILLYFTDKEIQQSVEKLNYAGRINQALPGQDYLHINNVNFAGAKANLFVSESIVSKTNVSSGKVNREVTINFRNPYPHSDCNLERGGLCINATLRNWIRVYVPHGSQLIEFKGSQKKVNVYEDLGKTVFEGYLEVPTQGMAKVEVNYVLPSDIDSKNYSLYIQKQPGTDGVKLSAFFNGKTLYEGVLDKDLKIK